jgi:CubicO group peptidase (beta-lactamase class C family)
MTHHLLRPLGMDSTAWNAGAAPHGRIAVGYWGDQDPLTEAPRVGDGVFEPAGGMYTTLHDYARYLAFQLNAYPARAEPDRGPVRRSTLRETHQPQRAAPRFEQPIAARTESGVQLQESNYGFGWLSETSCAYRERLEHGGWEPGYHAGVIMLPAQRIAIVTMSTSQPVRSAEGILKLLREADALPAPLEAAASAELVAARQSCVELLYTPGCDELDLNHGNFIPLPMPAWLALCAGSFWGGLLPLIAGWI